MAVGGSVHEWPAAAAGPGPVDRRPADAPEPRFRRNAFLDALARTSSEGPPPPSRRTTLHRSNRP